MNKYKLHLFLCFFLDEKFVTNELPNTLNHNENIEMEQSLSHPIMKSLSDSNDHNKSPVNFIDEIREDTGAHDKIPQTPSLDEGLKLCISGLEFSISNTKANGDYIVKIELKIPNDSLSKQGITNNKTRKSDETKKNEMEHAYDDVQKELLNGLSNDTLDDSTSNATLLGQEREIPRTLSPLKIRRMDKKTFQRSERSNRIENSTGISFSDRHITDGSSKYQKRNSRVEGITALDTCRICGDAASKFIHYGGRSCQSCRAFFRRTVEKQHK